MLGLSMPPSVARSHQEYLENKIKLLRNRSLLEKGKTGETWRGTQESKEIERRETQ